MPVDALPSDIKELGKKLNSFSKQLKGCEKALKERFEEFVKVFGSVSLDCRRNELAASAIALLIEIIFRLFSFQMRC